jgi:hypothetical protein
MRNLDEHTIRCRSIIRKLGNQVRKENSRQMQVFCYCGRGNW